MDLVPSRPVTASARDRRGVVVLGKGTLACRVIDWFLEESDHDLRLVVPVVPEPEWTDSVVELARSRNIAFVESGDFRDIPPDRTFDLAVSVYYNRIVTPDFIGRCARIVNIHNGPLPRYRGIAPINWALKNGESSHGVTMHEITPGIDDGPIVAQVTYSIYPEFDEVQDVYARAIEYAWALFTQTMPVLDQIHARPQDDSQAIYYSRKDAARLGDRSGFTRALSAG